MIHAKADFFNQVAEEIRAKYFPDETHGSTQNKNYHAATLAIELFNNGCLTYRAFIGRLAKCCNSNNATIHNIVERYIISFGAYQYKPSSKWSISKVDTSKHTSTKA